MISLFSARCSTILSRAGDLDRSWKASFQRSGVRTVNSRFLLTRYRVQCYSSKKSGGDSSRQRSDHRKLRTNKEEFFVVRKGDIVGVYKSLTEFETLVGTPVGDPPVSVYKGCSMPKDTKTYLGSNGLVNALYTISARDLTQELFGNLVACQFQRSCTLEFDGASKGNPGQAGAGAILRYDDGSLICRLCEGLGIATCNFAEYRGFILGLKYAVEKGYTNIRVKGDSKLVCMQIQGLWRVRSENLLTLYKEAEKLKGRFHSFQIMHVLRDLNSEADAQANLGVRLAEGEIQEDFDT